MFGIGQWYADRRSVNKAEKAWNNGVPLLSEENVQYASLHHAQHWVQWAGKLEMARYYEYSPQSPEVTRIVHQNFWLAMMAAHGAQQALYWDNAVRTAGMEGNLSIIEAYAQTFGLSTALDAVEKFGVLHPRVIGWQAENGMVSKTHVHALVDLNEQIPRFSGWDAQEFVKGGPALLSWILDWVELPDAVINARDGYAMSRYISEVIDAMDAEAGERAADGTSTLKNGHQYRKTRVWTKVSDLATPVIAGPALVMLRSLYQRFGFDPMLMDAILGRWTEGDTADPRVCSVLHYMDVEKMGLPGMSWRGHMAEGETERNAWRSTIESRADTVLFHMLELQADRHDNLSIYQAALPFFRPKLALQAVAEQYDVGALVAD